MEKELEDLLKDIHVMIQKSIIRINDKDYDEAIEELEKIKVKIDKKIKR